MSKISELVTNDFYMQELQLIAFLCMKRKSIIVMEACEKEGASDLYRHACALIRNYDEQTN